jgi:hypothetical protein
MNIKILWHIWQNWNLIVIMCIWVQMNKFLTFIALLLFDNVDAFGRNNLVCDFQLNYGRDRNRVISNPAVWAVWAVDTSVDQIR